MDLSKKIYASAYWGVTIFILLLIVASVLLPELRKDGVLSDAFISFSQTPLWIGLGLCGLVMWVFALQRLIFVWQWASLSRKVSAVLFIVLFPGLCGYYLYFVDKQERVNRAIKAAREKLDLDEAQ
ncbi:MAG: hypothetical protein COB33_012015 [Thiotrichaceae bacterium]|nr:hypothetical protein [Thiotrichaceae bacterium]PCI14384.1 MAG: hypothetical protein COB71_03470 [Thiotrichales bacterium]